uniref:Uncharacterized protein n=1 Tax=Arundo donax TaxID=35708 RepID=A0A0A9U2R5_ARUDO
MRTTTSPCFSAPSVAACRRSPHNRRPPACIPAAVAAEETPPTPCEVTGSRTRRRRQDQRPRRACRRPWEERQGDPARRSRARPGSRWRPRLPSPCSDSDALIFRRRAQTWTRGVTPHLIRSMSFRSERIKVDPTGSSPRRLPASACSRHPRSGHLGAAPPHHVLWISRSPTPVVERWTFSSTISDERSAQRSTHRTRWRSR